MNRPRYLLRVARGRWFRCWTIVVLGLIIASRYDPGVPHSAQAAAVTAGYRDFSYSASGVSAPTGQKPQSKLWFNDGIWWGSLFSRSADAFNIYRFNWATQTWSDTGTVIDERNGSSADTLWDGNRLYVVTAGKSSSSSGDSGRLLRYSYNSASQSYTLDSGFPVTIVSGGMEAIVSISFPFSPPSRYSQGGGQR